MPRASIAFQTVFDEACAACGYTAAEVAAGAALQADMLRRFNEAFQVAVDIPGAGWEDLRQWAEISPVDDLTIDYSVLGDARQFQLWTVDPRSDETLAQSVAFTTSSSGLRLRSALDTVYASWMPEVVRFGITAWLTGTAYAVGDVRMTNGRCYRCLTAHTSGTFATDLAAAKWIELSVPGIFRTFLSRYVRGIYQLESGQAETGYKLQATARRDLEELHVRELNQSTPS